VRRRTELPVLISREAKHQRLPAKVASDIVTLAPIDEQAGWFYCLALPEYVTQCYLYCIRLDGSSDPEGVAMA
jgi:hypothetical protein